MRVILLILVIILLFAGIIYALVKKKGAKKSEKFSNPKNSPKNSCVRDRFSKEFSEKIVNNLVKDINKIYPFDELDLSFKPLECCVLEDSATEDKNKISICVKNKGGRYYNYNKLMQVIIHEMAHVLSKSVDTTHKSKEFRDNYLFLMDRAVSLKIIDPKKLERE